MTNEGLHGLRAFRGRLHDQLMLIPEYRAIAVIDRTIAEIAQIFDSLAPPAPVAERPAAAPAREHAPIVRPVAEGTPISDAAQTRIAMAIAEAIESNVSQIRTPRMPAAAPYMLVGAAS
jgi:hypothetical protein